MRVIDLFAGLKGWSEPWQQAGHEVVTTDINPKFKCTVTHDIRALTDSDLLSHFSDNSKPLVVLASPPCEAFSVMRIGKNWTYDHQPKTDAARLGKELLEFTVAMIKILNPQIWLIENPRGKMRRMEVLSGFERRTVTYCQFGEKRMKPTDLWGGFPDNLVLPRPCKNGDPCHVAAPRGSTTGTQGMDSALSAKIPYPLAKMVMDASLATLQ